MPMDWTSAGLGALGGGLAAGGLAGLFGDGGKSSKSRGGFDMGIPAMMAPYFQPYIAAGARSLPGLEAQFQGATNILPFLMGQYGQLTGGLPGLQEQYGQLMQDPSGMLAKMGAGYQESPGYKRSKYEAEQSALNAAAAGGMAGSPMHQQYAADISEQLANRDYENYLSRVLGLYVQGLGGAQQLGQLGLGMGMGLEQEGLETGLGLGKIGAGAAIGFGEDIGSYLAQQQMMNFMKEQAGKKKSSDLWSSLLGALGTAGGAFLGSYGGPGGTAAGAKAGGTFGSAISSQLANMFS